MKVLVWGNSHVGAIIQGWSAVRETHSEFTLHFVASLGRHMQKATVVGGHIGNVQHKNPPELFDIAAYDAFVVVADLPTVRFVARGILNRGFSRAVEDAAILDLIDGSASGFIVSQLIRPWSGRPVLMLSMPERQSNKSRLDPLLYDLATARLTEAVRTKNAAYVPRPRTLLDADLVPLSRYYQGAVDMRGRPAEHRQKAKANVGHLNPDGGRETVLAILAALSRLPNGEQ